MSNLSIIDGNYRDGTRAVTRSNDNIQVGAVIRHRDTSSNPIYTPNVGIGWPITAFGELQAESKTPQIQVKFPYNINDELVQTNLNGTDASTPSSTSAANGQATVTCGDATNTFAQIHSKDIVRYGPGQGAEVLGTATFTTGVAGSEQVFIAGNTDEGFGFGYNGTTFGILHRKGGSREVKSLEITAGATNSGNITIELDGESTTIAVAASDTIAEVVAKIVATDFGDIGKGWNTHTDDNVNVLFISYLSENAGGSFSFTDTGTTGVTTGAFSEPVSGAAPTDTWIAQSSWNIDVMDGTGPSLQTLDPTQGNVYGLDFQYLGYGLIRFFIENSELGLLQIVHEIKYSNSNTTPSLINPSLELGVYCKNTTNNTALSVSTASWGGFIQGQETTGGIRHAISNTKSTNGTTTTNVLTVHNEVYFQSALNKVHVYPDLLTVSVLGGNRTVVFKIISVPTEVSGTVSFTNIDTNSSVMVYDTAGTTVIGGTEKLIIAVEAGDSKVIDMKNMNQHMNPGDRWALTAELSSSGTDATVTAGITWIERI